MTQQHPITPPPELFVKWLAEAKRLHPGESTGFIAGEVARLAYQTGADQELEACCEWLNGGSKIDYDTAKLLRAARRPKPPSLKEQALEIVRGTPVNSAGLYSYEDVEIIRRALEQLDD